MTSKGFGTAGVVDTTGKLAGIVTDGDLRRHMSNEMFAQHAKDVMTTPPRTIAASALIAEAVHEMNAGGPRPILCLFVTEGAKPIGIIHMHDCLRAGMR
jgi:arabinose-5-phosphate isomerase